METNETSPPAGLLRRLAAIFYDLLLLVALIMLMTFVFVAVTSGEAITRIWLLRAWILLVSFGFFGWFWTHGGQTLGMRAWRLKLVRDDGGTITWPDATRRFAAAVVSWLPAGLGFLWSLFDGERRAWHDQWSQTRLVLMPKKQDR